MKLIVLSVSLADKIQSLSQKLEPGEFIVQRVVELARLNDELKGMSSEHHLCGILTTIPPAQHTIGR